MTGFDALQNERFAALEFVPDSGGGGLRDH
jgi:hypothetical protein